MLCSATQQVNLSNNVAFNLQIDTRQLSGYTVGTACFDKATSPSGVVPKTTVDAIASTQNRQ